VAREEQVNTVVTNALEKASDDNAKLRDRATKLKNETKRLRVKAVRAPGQRSHAVKVAVSKAVKKVRVDSAIWRVKRPDGRIENWIRELIAKLIAVRHLPATQAPGAITDIVRAIKAHATGTDDDGTVETFSDRSARRFLLEGHVMGKIQTAKEFRAAPGWLLVPSLLRHALTYLKLGPQVVMALHTKVPTLYPTLPHSPLFHLRTKLRARRTTLLIVVSSEPPARSTTRPRLSEKTG
jgi:hypothetical protein